MEPNMNNKTDKEIVEEAYKDLIDYYTQTRQFKKMKDFVTAYRNLYKASPLPSHNSNKESIKEKIRIEIEKHDQEERARLEREERERGKQEKRARAFMIKAQKDYPDSENFDEVIPCKWTEDELEVVEDKDAVLSYGLIGNQYKKTLVIPQGVNHIGNNAFAGCEHFNSVSFPNGITSIGDNAFAATTLEGELIIPEGVESIGTYAFGGTSLNSVRLPNSLFSIGDNVFESTNVEEIIVPKGTKDRFKKLFEGQPGGIDQYSYKKVDLSKKIVEE